MRALTRAGYGLHLFEPRWFEPEQKQQSFKSPTVVPTPDKSQIVHGLKDACADDALWLVTAIVQYIRETGDMAFAHQVVTYADGGEGTAENAKKLLPYGVDTVYVYEHPGFEGFRADCCADAVADCIAAIKPSSVLIGATALGRSLAPRLSTRFHTGLTADCTTLDIEPSTDMVQIRPAFGGNIMAQIAITTARRALQ